MNKELAQAAMQFLLRTQLQGHEVHAFNAVMNALNEIANGAQKQITAPKEGNQQS